MIIVIIMIIIFIMITIQHDELRHDEYENSNLHFVSVSITGVTWNVWFSTCQDGSVKLWTFEWGALCPADPFASHLQLWAVEVSGIESLGVSTQPC